MFASILLLFVLPWLDTSKVRSAVYRPLYKQFFWILVIVCIGLGYLGAKPAEGGYVIAARILTFWYFFHFLVLLPLLGCLRTEAATGLNIRSGPCKIEGQRRCDARRRRGRARETLLREART